MNGRPPLITNATARSINNGHNEMILVHALRHKGNVINCTII